MSSDFSFSSFDRIERKARLASEQFDLVVIGGGATGTGIALDAASRGLKTALIEKHDFASGTSSKSTKLIHGGLRYLKQLDVALVRESGTERAAVNKLAPHLCLPEKMLLPLVKGGTFGKYSTAVGLWVYDFLAGVDSSDKRVMLSKTDTIKKEPLLDPETLKGSGYYAEYRTDDARLTIELIKKATAYGATAINYLEAVAFDYEGDIINGVKCTDQLDGATIRIKAKKVVSAGGPWVDKLRSINNSLNHKKLRLTKGVHVVLPYHRLPIQQSVYFDVPDGRMIFAIPRGKVTYVGTTDTEFTGSLDRVVATQKDRDYLVKAVNNTFPTLDLTEHDVISNWAGLRPLIHEDGKSPSELSRKDEIFTAKDGLVSIAGGKLTGYRKMAERIVDKIMKQLCNENDREYVNTKTKNIPLTPEPLTSNQEVKNYIKELTKKCKGLSLNESDGWYLVTNYGRQAKYILDEVERSDHQDPLLNLALAELSFCLNHEMIQRAEDFIVRRTGRLYFDILSLKKIKEPIISTMSKKLGWSDQREEQERLIVNALIHDATHFYDDERIPSILSEITVV